MWSYYELTTAQNQADRIQSAGYTVSPAAKREFPQDAIARALAQRLRADRNEKQAAQRTLLVALVDGIKAILRGPATHAR